MPLRLELILKDIKIATVDEIQNMEYIYLMDNNISYTVRSQKDIDDALSENLKLLIMSDSQKFYRGTFGIKLVYVEGGASVILRMTLPENWEESVAAGGGGKRKHKKSKRKHKKSRPQRKKSKRKSK